MLPLVVAKQKDAKVLKDDYKLGWLMQDGKQETEDDKQGYWMVWGSSKNLELALSVVKELLEEKGERAVFISDEPLSKGYVSKDCIKNLRRLQIN